MRAPLHIGLIMQGGTAWMGGAEYIKNLALALAAVAREEPGAFRVTLITGAALDEHWRRELASVQQVVELPARQRGLLARWLRLGQRRFTAAVQRAGCDFIYPLTYDNGYNVGASFPLKLGRTRWAGWIPDFQHKLLPQLFSAAEIAKRDRGIAQLAGHARSIVFSSAATAEDFRRFCPAATVDVELLRFCTAPTLEWSAGDPLAVQEKYHLPDRFLLISNQLWQHKNHLLVIEALALLAAQDIRPHVVCTGQPSDFRDKNFLNLVLQRVHECGVAAHFALLGLIPRGDQMQLMRRCVAVVQPSLCEGWSTVVEDARLLGKDVVLSDLAVHREQNPPGARFFDPRSAASLAAALEEAWARGVPGPDSQGELEAGATAAQAQLAFGRRFLEIARKICAS